MAEEPRNRLDPDEDSQAPFLLPEMEQLSDLQFVLRQFEEHGLEDEMASDATTLRLMGRSPSPPASLQANSEGSVGCWLKACVMIIA